MTELTSQFRKPKDHEFATLLRPCRFHIGRNRRRMLLMSWLRRSGPIVFVAALLGLLGTLLLPSRLGIFAGSAAAAIGWASIAGLIAWRNNPGEPGLIESAQRLDLAGQNHDRIATALSLQASGKNSVFAAAAIGQGIESLRRHRDCMPYMEKVVTPWMHAAAMVAGSVVLIGTLFLANAISPSRSRTTVSPDARSWAGSRPAEADASRQKGPLVKTHGPEPTAALPADFKAGCIEHGAIFGLGDEAPTGGAQFSAKPDAVTDAAGRTDGPAPRADGRSGSSLSPRDTSAEMSTGSAGSRGRESMPLREPAEPGEIPGTGSGGGDDPYKATGSSPIRAIADVSDDGGDRHVHMRTTSDDSRSADLEGGATFHGEPFLPDSDQAPSRDLGRGQGDGQGQTGSGRGGPSSIEKSRQSAPLLLGTPVPDTLRGVVGPGPAQVRLLPRAPRSGLAPPAVAGTTTPIDAGEFHVPAATLPPEVRGIVKQFLISLHGGGANFLPMRSDSGASAPKEK